ncbi:hypothetical protein AVEN_245206-1 [Araneus ventricosus]|uniref:Uncharacterized protein n=1 Tax=Araneus ventricosus TaxID=182803 RepID=A0A4Y2IKE3_ARAVE|nr:hypothetical protein AVEN_245206-1 [Araneus ventricosus]
MYHLEALQFISAPDLTLSAGLKMTDVQLELLTGVDIVKSLLLWFPRKRATQEIPKASEEGSVRSRKRQRLTQTQRGSEKEGMVSFVRPHM